MESEDIRKTTGCKKPCFYKRYSFIGEKLQTDFLADEFVFSLWAVSNYTMLETEQLIYPLARGQKNIFCPGRALFKNKLSAKTREFRKAENATKVCKL